MAFPGIYALQYRGERLDAYAEFAFHHSLVSVVDGKDEEEVLLYVGRGNNVGARLRRHAKVIADYQWDGGFELRHFAYTAIPVAEYWMAYSFEALAIEEWKPVFNDVVTGLGAGGKGSFAIYLADPASLSAAEAIQRKNIVEAVRGDAKASRAAWSDDPPGRPTEAELAAWDQFDDEERSVDETLGWG